MHFPTQVSPNSDILDGILDVCHIDKAALKTVMELIASSLSGDHPPEDEVAPHPVIHTWEFAFSNGRPEPLSRDGSEDVA